MTTSILEDTSLKFQPNGPHRYSKAKIRKRPCPSIEMVSFLLKDETEGCFPKYPKIMKHVEDSLPKGTIGQDKEVIVSFTTAIAHDTYI